MSPARMVCCAVCGQPHASSEGWFQLIENRWTDRLKIVRFHASLESGLNVNTVCCAAHVRELVVHWMTMGRLDIPFARVPSGTHVKFFRRSASRDSEVREPFLPLSVVLGELSVHRESLTRILRENPAALSSVLETLIHALDPEPGRRPQVTTDADRIPAEEAVAV